MSAEDPTGLADNPLRVSRRLIYLHRLVGDDVLTPKPKNRKPNPWRVTVVFLFYTICATMAILNYIDVGYVADVNVALRDVLGRTPYTVTDGVEKMPKDITSASDVRLYLLNVILPQLTIGKAYSEPNSMRAFNRVLNRVGFCEDTAVVLLTIRRIKAESDPKETTTKRFSALYPKVWKGNGVAANSRGDTEHEDVADMWRLFSWPHTRKSPIGLDKLGYADREATPLTTKFINSNTQPNVTLNALWKHSKSCSGETCGYDGGFGNNGGFVAAIVVQNNALLKASHASMEARGNSIRFPELQNVAKELFIHLLDPQGTPEINNVTGTCGLGVKSTNILRFEDFMNAGFLDEYTASVSVDFHTYNSNKQTSSEVSIQWKVLESGVVEGPFKIHVDTIRLDLNATYVVFFEVIYILGTAFYFIELFVYKLYKNSYKLFSQIWTWVNTVSIAASCMSVAFRFQYGAANKHFLVNSGAVNFELDDITESLNDQKKLAYFYQVFSSFALVTIWLRIVELLAKTPPRVKLLEKTLAKAISGMIMYFCYINVILVGFWAFVAVHFASVSLNFSHPVRAFISCFEMLCLNITPYKDTAGAALRSFFLFPYFLFSIISVQMFNSIINYAYNRVSIDMEPVFKKLARDKLLKGKNDHNSLWWARYYIKLACRWIKGKLGCGTEQEDNVEPDATDAPAHHRGEMEAAPQTDDLGPNEKELVENFQEQGQKKMADEGVGTILLYVIFAVSYTLFLYLALRTDTNGRVSEVVSSTLFDRKIAMIHPNGESYFRDFHEVSSIYEANLWLRSALPEIVRQGNLQKSEEFFDNSYDLSCLNGWNCLLAGTRADGQAAHSMIRITKRLFEKVPNSGLVEVHPGSPLNLQRFAAGEKLLPYRLPSKKINALDPATPNEDVTTSGDLFADGRQFCQRDDNGGFHHNGGLVCLLDAHVSNMTSQLSSMMHAGFFSPTTAALIVEFVGFNPNTNTLFHVTLEFLHQPSGFVRPRGTVTAFSLLNLDTPEKGADFVSVAIVAVKNMVKLEFLCGEVYIMLTVYFIVGMLKEMKQDVYRKMFNEGKGAGQCVLEFFVLDIFHTLDAVSYLISIASFMCFMKWMAMQVEIEATKDADFAEFLTYISELLSEQIMYQRLSTCNLVFICLRPLKFLRNDPRMTKLNMTLFLATEDIAWFIVILSIFFTGFVLFAHLMFGIHVPALSDPLHASIYCFKFLIGAFNFEELWTVDPWPATIFVFCFLFLFKFFFLNVFFAIIDRVFVSGENPPPNIRRSLKPVFGRLCRCIEWDRDLVMEGDDEKALDDAPLTRSGRVHVFALQIQAIKDTDADGEEGGAARKSKTLTDVCDVDERMEEVIRWSREEAKAFVETYKKMLQAKQEFANDDIFIKTKVAAFIAKELEGVRETMHEAERHQRYAIMVNETLAKKDQETISKYILRLEKRITSKKKESHRLETDVCHLKAESHKMRYTDEEIKHLEDAASAPKEATQLQQTAMGDKAQDPVVAGLAKPPEDDEPEEGDADEDASNEKEEDRCQGNTTGDLLKALGEDEWS